MTEVPALPNMEPFGLTADDWHVEEALLARDDARVDGEGAAEDGERVVDADFVVELRLVWGFGRKKPSSRGGCGCFCKCGGMLKVPSWVDRIFEGPVKPTADRVLSKEQAF